MELRTWCTDCTLVAQPTVGTCQSQMKPAKRCSLLFVSDNMLASETAHAGSFCNAAPVLHLLLQHPQTDPELTAALQEPTHLYFAPAAATLYRTDCVTCRPDVGLMTALQQHIHSTLSLVQDQSLVSTIWALAKLQDTPEQRQPGSSSPGSKKMGNLQQLQPGSKLAGKQEPIPATDAAGLQAGAGHERILVGTATTGAAAAAGDGEVSLRQLVKALMWRCDPQMHHWSGRDLAQAAWGLGKLGARPSAVWKEVRRAVALV